MPPRRPFRRNTLRPLAPILPIAPRVPGVGASISRPAIAVPPALQEANRLFMQGRYVPAAERYAGLAAGAEQRGMPQATHLYLQAARAMLLAHHPGRAEQLAQQGLQILVAHRRFGRVHQLGARVVEEFELQGHKLQAQHLSAWLATVLPHAVGELEDRQAEDGEMGKGEADHDPIQVNRTGRGGVLPRFCPSCGAPVDPRDVEWADDDTAICAFCGIALTGEE